MKPLLLAVVMLAGGLAGWWTGGAPLLPTAEILHANRKLRVSELPPEVRLRVAQVRQARCPAERLRQAVILATQLPLADFSSWLAGDYLGFLDDGMEAVFEQIVIDRWLAADPAGGASWLLKNGQGSAEKAVAAWLRVDEPAVMAMVKSLPAATSEEAVSALIVAVGKRSVPEALDLLDELGPPALASREVVARLARLDREAVLDYAAATTGEQRRGLLTEVAGAWLEPDLRWVVAMLQREGLGPEVLEQLAQSSGHGSTGLTVLRQAAFIPLGWLETLSQRDHGQLTSGCEIEWLKLKTGKPGLPKAVLQKLQLQAAAAPFWHHDKRETGLKLVADGTWLPRPARVLIAENLAHLWQDDPAAASRWVASLEGDLRVAGERGLTSQRTAMAAAQQARQLTSPAEVMGALASATLTGFPRHDVEWDAAETADAVRLAERLAPAQVAGLLGAIENDHGSLPRPVLGAILSQAFAVPLVTGPGREGFERERVRAACRLAAGWAGTAPAQAAAWVETLPAGEARLWAAKNVARQWQYYSTAETRDWAAKLPEPERKAALALLADPL
ncbi:MAG: hypothetical protein RLZZ522_99 [Verrucomicrobiota bacterium]